MGSDLFGSFAEATVAALVVSGGSEKMTHHGYFFYPLILSATGIFVCLLTTFFIPCFSIKASTSNSSKFKKKLKNIEKILKKNVYLFKFFSKTYIKNYRILSIRNNRRNPKMANNNLNSSPNPCNFNSLKLLPPRR